MEECRATIYSDRLTIDSTIAILEHLPSPRRMRAQYTNRPSCPISYPSIQETKRAFIDAVQKDFSYIELVSLFYRMPEDPDEELSAFVNVDLYRISAQHFVPEGILDRQKRMVACITQQGGKLDERFYDFAQAIIERLPHGKIDTAEIQIRRKYKKDKLEKTKIHPHYIGFSHVLPGARPVIPSVEYAAWINFLKEEFC